MNMMSTVTCTQITITSVSSDTHGQPVIHTDSH